MRTGTKPCSGRARTDRFHFASLDGQGVDPEATEFGSAFIMFPPKRMATSPARCVLDDLRDLCTGPFDHPWARYRSRVSVVASSVQPYDESLRLAENQS